jgi:hypothetical protein
MRVYLLEKQNASLGTIHKILKEMLDPTFIIPYNSTEGAIAIVRQLSCTLHLESEMPLYTKIRQYINKIWIVGADPNQGALREFNTEMEMVEMLSAVKPGEQ